MNEEAIQDAYEMFKSGGYNGSIDDYKQLISTNGNALNDSYEIFKGGGYGDDINSFKNLMGIGSIKKKSQAENGGSTSAVGSLELQKPEDYTYGDSKSAYRKQGNQWLISNESTKGNYVAIKDPTGSRAKELEKNAVKKDNKFISKETKKEYQLEDNNFSEVNPEKQKALRELNAMKYAPPKPGPMGSGSMPAFSAEAIKIKEDEYNNIPSRINLEDDDKIKALNKQFGKNASLEADYETFGDYDNSPEKKDNKYRIKNNSWERLVPGATEWSPISNEGSIGALNRRYGKNIDAKKAIVVKPKEIDPFLKVNSNFLAQSEESAQQMLEKNFKGMGFTFEQTGAGGDYIKVTPNNGAEPQIFSFNNVGNSTRGAFSSPTGMGIGNNNSEELKKNADQSVKLQSYLRLNASAENEDDLSPVNRIKNNISIREKKYDLSPLEKNNEYYNTEDYKNNFKELTFQQKKQEIKRRVDENASLSASYGKGVLGDIYTSVFGEDEKYYKTEKDLKKLKNKLNSSEEYKLFISEEKKYNEQQEDKYGKLYDELSIAKQSGNKEAIKTAKAKIGAGFSKEVIGDNLNNMTGHQYDLQRGINDFNKRKEKLELDAKNGNLTQEQYNDAVEGLSSEAQRLDVAAKNIAATQKKMNVLAGIYATEKAKSGGFFGNFTNSLLVGVDELISSDGLSGKKQRQQDEIEIKSQDITPQQRQYYKDKGYNDEQIKNVFINNAQKNAIAANKRAIIETFGSDLTTEESKQNLGFVEQALVGVAASLPSMALSLIPVVGQAAAFGGMANMSYNAINEEMLNDTDFETTSEGDRAIVAIPYAVVMGALEKVGMNKMLKGESTIGKIVLSRIAKIIPKGATREVIENIANKEVKSLVAKGALKVIGGTLAEAETGALQAGLLDVGLKSLFNVLDPLDLKLTNKEELTGGEAFATPDTKMGVAGAILEGSAAEAIGGFAMSTVMVGAQGLINGKISLYNEEDLKFFEDFTSDQEFKKLIVSNLKTQMLNGTMTKGEAQSALNDIDLVEGVFNSIDENISDESKLIAFNLINERNRLEKEIVGKDPALSKEKNDRIKDINDKLGTLPLQVLVVNNIERATKLENALKQKGAVIIDGETINRKAAQTELDKINQKVIDAERKQEKDATETVTAETTEVTQKRTERIAELETTLSQSKNNKGTITIDDKIIPRIELENELKTLKIEQNAVQEQAAGQVPVQPTTTVGEEVVQGEPTAEPQGLTEEGQKVEIGGIIRGHETISGEKSIGDVREKLPNQNNGIVIVEGKDGGQYAVAFSRKGGDGKNIFEQGVLTPRPGYISASVKIDENATPEQIKEAQQKAQRNLDIILPTVVDGVINAQVINDALAQAEPQVITEKGKAEEVVLTERQKLEAEIAKKKAKAPKAPVIEAPSLEVPIIEATEAETPVTKAEAPKAKGKPTVMSWSKVEEYDDAVIRSMKEIQYGKLKPLLELGKRTTVAQKEEIKTIQEKISTAEKILGRRANKIKKEAQRVEKEGKGATVRAVDNNGTEAEYNVVVSKDGATAKVQLKKIGTLTPKRASVEANLTIETDEKRGRFVITKNKTKVYIDEAITTAKVEPTKAKVTSKAKVKVEPVKEEAPAPAKESTEDLMGVINSIKEDIKNTTEEIKKAREEARKEVNKINAENIDLDDLEADIKEIEDNLKDELAILQGELDGHIKALKEEVKSLGDLDSKAPENKKTLLTYINEAITTLNGLNKLTYAGIGVGTSLATMKLVLKGIRAAVIAGKTINQGINEMYTKYKGRHKNVSRAQFIKDINDFLDNTFVEQKTNKQDIQEARDKFVEIREAVRKAKLAVKTESQESRKKAFDAIRKMLTGKVKNLSAVQLNSIMLRLASFNALSQTQYDKFIDYVDKVIGIADYDDKVAKANENRETAKKNLPKLGDISSDLLDPLSRVLSINAKLIPSDVFESYAEIVEMLSKRDAVLKLNKRADLNESLDKIIESIESNEQRISDLKDLYDNFAGKTADYAETLDEMLKVGLINQAEHKLMKTFKSKIQAPKVKDKMTEQQIADEKVELIDEINNTTITLDEIVGDEFRLERDLVKKLQALLKNKKTLESLNNKDLKDLLRVIDNINNGFVSNATQEMVEKLNFIEKSILLESSIPETFKVITARINQSLEKRISKRINVAPLFNIDQQLGDFKTKNIFNSVFNESAKAQQGYQAAITLIQDELDKIERGIATSFENEPNKIILSQFKMMVYMMQLEYDSNPSKQEGSKKQVHQAMKTLDETIKFAKQNSEKSGYNDLDIAQMEFIKKEFAKDGQEFEEDGKTKKKIIDIDKLYNSFNESEKNGLKKLQEINDRMTKFATYTATVINGKKIVPLKNYISYTVINESDILSASETTDQINNINANMDPGTVSKNLEERDGKAHPVYLNPFYATNSSSRSVLLNYHMTEPVRTARKTLRNAKTLLEEKKGTTKDQYDILNAITGAYNTATKDLLESNFTQSNKILEFLKRQGYRAMLASSTRAAAELSSNVIFVLANNKFDMARGLSKQIINIEAADRKSIMTNLGATVESRLYPTSSINSAFVELTTNKNRSSKGRKTKTEAENVVIQAWDETAKKYVLMPVAGLADYVISKPDQLVMRPLWFGAFSRAFEKEAGIKPDFDKIMENNEEYMDKYKDALEKATTMADKQVISAGSSTNAYMGILQNVVREGDKVAAWTKEFNRFMNKFTVQEYYTAREGVRALVGNGTISRSDGAHVLAAVTLRMTSYFLFTRLFSEGLAVVARSLGFGGDDDDDDKTAKQKISQGILSSITTLVFGRYFGNFIRVAENALIELVNKEYGEAIGLRDGEYDPYEDAIQFNQLQEGKVDKLTDLFKVMAGPLSPVIGTAELAYKLAISPKPEGERAKLTRAKELYRRLPLEIGGLAGVVPFYKDVRKIVMEGVYKELKKEVKEKAVKKEAEAKTDAEEIVQKTSILKQMMNSGAYTREGIKKELRKIKDPEYRKAENKIEEDMLKSILDKTKYSSRTDFEKREKENAKNAFKMYDKKREESLKILNELRNRMDALEYGEQYVSKEEKSSGTNYDEGVGYDDGVGNETNYDEGVGYDEGVTKSRKQTKSRRFRRY